MSPTVTLLKGVYVMKERTMSKKNKAKTAERTQEETVAQDANLVLKPREKK